MMEITVKDTNAADHFVDHYKIQWELSTRKINQKLLYGAIVYAGFILLGIYALVGEFLDDGKSEAMHGSDSCRWSCNSYWSNDVPSSFQQQKNL